MGKKQSNENRTSRIKMEHKRVRVEPLFQDGSQEKKKNIFKDIDLIFFPPCLA